METEDSELGVMNFGVLRIFFLGIFLVTLYVAIDLDDFSTGITMRLPPTCGRSSRRLNICRNNWKASRPWMISVNDFGLRRTEE